MSKIYVAIIDEHPLFAEGISAILDHVGDFDVSLKLSSVKEFHNNPLGNSINVLIRNLAKVTTADIEEISGLITKFPKLKVLIISGNDGESTIFKMIKAGVKGYLTLDSSRQELIEAVYSLRGGYDYFSKCIMDIIVGNYINKIKTKDSDENQLEKLSTREIEILKLWGNGFSNREIADKLFISVRTVESHKTHIMQKLNLKTSVDLLKYAIRNNIIDV